jgi:formylglycine-generating enzyme required for sulfatase activity
MVSIPAGPFIRGSSQRGLDGGLSLCRDTYSKPVDCTTQWFKREVPQRSVVLSAFEIDRFEVTNSQFTTCVKAGACGPVKYEECSIYNLSSGVWSTGTSGGPELHNPHHPVVCVTWKQANDFCAWAGKRLPSEAQWEKAARGDKDARDFPWGDRWSPALLNWGELGGFGKIDGYKTTAPVGAFPYNVSPYGAYDMAGNAWEWTSDPFDAGFYTRDPMVDPENDSPANLRSLRGGSWSFSGNGARLTYRFFASEDHRDDGIGFRCAK